MKKYNINHFIFTTFIFITYLFVFSCNNTITTDSNEPNIQKKYSKIVVFCSDDRIQEALDAGATYAGNTELIDKVKSGWLDFDIVLATPDVMKDVGRLGMVLGRKGLMPTAQEGTITIDIVGTIKELLQ